MKKFIAILMLIGSVVTASGQETTPKAWISEILVDAAGNWTIEMGFDEWENAEIDSILLVTSAGSSRISSYSLIPGGGFPNFDSLSVINVANLVSALSINPLGDFVKLISYAWENYDTDSIAFGNYPGSKLDCIMDGESVIYVSYIESSGYKGGFCIESVPTIGAGNDTTGSMGNFSGMIYDLSGNPMTEGFFPLPGMYNTNIHIKPDGSFSDRIFARRNTFDTIFVHIPPWPYTIKTYTIEPVDFCLNPDSAYYHDIVATSLVMGIKDKEEDFENAVTVSPNPFSQKVTFYLNLKDTHPGDQMSLLVLTLDGREVLFIRLNQGQKRYEWAPASTVSPGIFIYRLEKDNKILKSGKFIKS
jgi:hypothetical protein